MSQAFSPSEIKQEQVSWLKKRNACEDANCLRAAYRLRLAQLADDPKWIPKDDWWFLATNDNPEVSRLKGMFISQTGHSASGQYFDLGSGAYFILMEVGEPNVGLWYAVPARHELIKLLGASVALTDVRRNKTIRTFRFEVRTPRYAGDFDVQVSDQPSKPKVITVREQTLDDKN